jgi:transcriptional regulator with XRE-family HTH domain
MDDLRFGAAIRRVRQRRGWRQVDLARKAGVSPTTISRVERGHARTLTLELVRAVAAALEVRVDLTARWRGGDLDRLLNAHHSTLHETVARMFRADLPDWVLAPEVSFSVFGERGVIDILAWHPGRRALLVIELKTDIADVNELVGTFDGKRRLARAIALERGWDPITVGAWVIVSGTRTNRRRIDAHRVMLRAAYPAGGPTMAAWLRKPESAISAISLWSRLAPAERSAMSSVRRVRRVPAA